MRANALLMSQEEECVLITHHTIGNSVGHSLAGCRQIENRLIWQCVVALKVKPLLEDMSMVGTTTGDNIDWNTQATTWSNNKSHLQSLNTLLPNFTFQVSTNSDISDLVGILSQAEWLQGTGQWERSALTRLFVIFKCLTHVISEKDGHVLLHWLHNSGIDSLLVGSRIEINVLCVIKGFLWICNDGTCLEGRADTMTITVGNYNKGNEDKNEKNLGSTGA
jgi:hypothetical protein